VRENGSFVAVDQPWHAEAQRLWNEGLSGGKIAERLGVTKNMVVGHVKRAGLRSHAAINRNGCEYKGSTLFTRLDAVHARFDRTMEELNRNKARYYAAE
jgi:hypothetical protein